MPSDWRTREWKTPLLIFGQKMSCKNSRTRGTKRVSPNQQQLTLAMCLMVNGREHASSECRLIGADTRRLAERERAMMMCINILSCPAVIILARAYNVHEKIIKFNGPLWEREKLFWLGGGGGWASERFKTCVIRARDWTELLCLHAR
jgi:hypothetical protein